ncbi:uncharacterized protein KQ657_001932 [Scheffersomyces spartinae]|uniref:Tubulin-specific chaperone A n=1 Tax=Scheffersomyces spartinae TaxID=45513 RepID=A0A9P7V6K1_9ASCO|nr:uncharacterized protein KQ657_001932 [Scheffersomyces spartinae]KAG7192214.1 hypothetical protein KQ657_001932 [Scheffersomyces spartinae]
MAPSPLQIKSNAVKRLIQENKLYLDEVEENKQLVAKLEADGGDVYDIKKAKQVLDESERMVAHMGKLLDTHRGALKTFLETYKGDEDTSEAQSLLE